MQEELRRTKDFLLNLIESSARRDRRPPTWKGASCSSTRSPSVSPATPASVANREERGHALSARRGARDHDGPPRGPGTVEWERFTTAGRACSPASASWCRSTSRRRSSTTKAGEVASVGIFSDLRERLKMEETLQKAQRQLELSDSPGCGRRARGRCGARAEPAADLDHGLGGAAPAQGSRGSMVGYSVRTILSESERMAEIVRNLGQLTKYQTKPYVGGHADRRSTTCEPRRGSDDARRSDHCVLLASPLSAGAAFAEEALSAHDIAAKALENNTFSTSNARAEVDLEVSKEGKVIRKRSIITKIKRDQVAVRSFVEFKAPADVAGTKFLSVEPRGETADQFHLSPRVQEGEARRRRAALHELHGHRLLVLRSRRQPRRGCGVEATRRRAARRPGLLRHRRRAEEARRRHLRRTMLWVHKKHMLPMRIDFFGKDKTTVKKRLTVRKLEKLHERCGRVGLRDGDDRKGHRDPAEAGGRRLRDADRGRRYQPARASSADDCGVIGVALDLGIDRLLVDPRRDPRRACCVRRGARGAQAPSTAASPSDDEDVIEIPPPPKETPAICCAGGARVFSRHRGRRRSARAGIDPSGEPARGGHQLRSSGRARRRAGFRRAPGARSGARAKPLGVRGALVLLPRGDLARRRRSRSALHRDAGSARELVLRSLRSPRGALTFNWGASDLIGPCDVLNPLDYRRNFVAALDDLKIPVLAAELVTALGPLTVARG